MSVHLSHVEFGQYTDDDEAELEREEAEQQQKIKEFLAQELQDEDISFDVSFASYRSHGNLNEKSPKKNNKAEDCLLGSNENHTDVYQNIHHVPCPPSSINNVPNNPSSYLYSNGYMPPSSSSNHNRTPTKSPSQAFHNISNPYYVADDAYTNGMMANDECDGKQYLEDSHLRVLYNARGTTIETLEGQMKEQKEKYSKEIRVLQHKLTMTTSEKDGLSASVQQQQDLLQEHKHQITLLEKQLMNEQDEKHQLDSQIKELNEKLYASDCAMDTLQQQIKLLNQTESMARARVQHESMLATQRQRHEEEILSLKEKLDDLQQALSWKTEDLNRCHEMLDCNSSTSEIGILRNRLAQEEKKSIDLKEELEKRHKKYLESEEQLQLYEGLVKMQAAHLTSTPLNAVGAIMGKDEFNQTPLTSQAKVHEEQSTAGLGPNDSSFREELVKSLSINREKRQQINLLRDQLEYFQKQLHGRKALPVEDRDAQANVSPDLPCNKCKLVQYALDEKTKEFEKLLIDSKNEINQLHSDKAELRTNMSEMVREFDKQKVNDMQNQNKATLQLVDDVKANLLNEIQKVNEKEKKQLLSEIESLNGELLHTKEEYLNLCTEAKDLEDQMRKEFETERQREITELKQTLEMEYNNQLRKQEMSLTEKYVEDMQIEKVKWKEELEKENADKIEKSIMLAKADWIESYNAKRGENVNEKNNNDLASMKEKYEKLEEEVKELETKYSQQEEDCDNKWEKEFKKVQRSLNEHVATSRKLELDYKLKTALWNRSENEMKRKIESLLKEANKKCEKCQQAEEDAGLKTTSREKGMCAECSVLFKNQKNLWETREKELVVLLEDAQQQIRVRIGNLKNIPADADNDQDHNGKNVSLSVEDAKDIVDEGEMGSMSAEVQQWKDKYDECEKENTQLNNNVLSLKEDFVYTESCYERQIDDLQKQLAKSEESLTKAQDECSNEQENTKKVILESSRLKSTLSDLENKCSLMDGHHADEIRKLSEEIKTWKGKHNTLQEKKIELDEDLMKLKADNVSCEKKHQAKVDSLNNEINHLKLTISNNQNELAVEREKTNKLECKKLHEISSVGHRLNTLNSSKQKTMEYEYEKKIEDITGECNKWQLKYHDVEKDNIELERNIQLQSANVTSTENYFKKQLETLQGEVARLNEVLSQVQNELCVEKERSNKLDLECKQMTHNYNINLENVLSVEKRKWQTESAKLQEAVLKASEIDHNNFVKEIQNQTNHINEISKIKEEHDILIHNLKQGFREKLARITEMKKKWIREEEEKRSQIEKKIKEKYTCRVNEIQEQHENILRDQQAHWIKEIHQSKREQLSTLVGLREEVKMKDKLLLKEKQAFEEGESLSKKKMKDLIVQHHQEVENLKIEQLKNLQKEKRRLEQYYKLTQREPVASPKDTNEVLCVNHSSENDKPVNDDELDGSEKTRHYYMETLERIQQDVMEHIVIMRTNADNEIREAVQRERKQIFQELNAKERNMSTSSPKAEKGEEFGSTTFTNSLINASGMVFKDLPPAN